MKKKALLMVLAAVVLVAGSIGGTLAWLTDSDAVINTFSIGQVDITASEPLWNASIDHKLVPGKVLTKDPTVTVESGSEKAYVFVKITTSSDVAAVLDYTMADGWVDVPNNLGVYYQIVDSSTADQSFPALNGNTITVKESATGTALAEISSVETEDFMRISFAAVQYEGMNGNVETAFSKVPSGF